MAEKLVSRYSTSKVSLYGLADEVPGCSRDSLVIIDVPSFEGVPESDLCFGTRQFNYVCFFQVGHILKPLSRLAARLHSQRLDQSQWLRSGEVDDALEMEEKTEAAAVEARPLLAAIKTGYLPMIKKSRRSMVKPIYRGGCLCGAVRFEADGPALNPHNCSCEFCQRHTGSLTASWVEFSATDVRWVGSGGSPAVYRSSDFSNRAFCPECGSSLGAIDDAPTIALLIGTFDDHRLPELKPDYHSFKPEKPIWG